MAEEWRFIEGTAGFYSVSDEGRVRSNQRTLTDKLGRIRTRRGKVLTQSLDQDGYLGVTIYYNTKPAWRTTHILVARAFLEGPRLETVNHKDWDQTNNKATNLEWATRAYNNSHSHLNRTYHPAKLSDEDVAAIRASSKRQCDLAEHYGVSKSLISRIISGQKRSQIA